MLPKNKKTLKIILLKQNHQNLNQKLNLLIQRVNNKVLTPK